MADLSITSTSVKAGSGAKKVSGIAGATVVAGEWVYLDGTTNTYKLADTDSATAAARSPAGIALNGAAADQPLTICTSGPVTIGAVVVVGDEYWLSGTAGKMCPKADVAAGDYPCLLGICTSTSVFDVKIHEAGAVKV